MKNKNISFKRKKTGKWNFSSFKKIQGAKLEEKNLLSFVESFEGIGFQATHFAQAIKLVEAMKKDKCAIFLSLTSNMVSSGLRETLAQLVKEKKVEAIITSTGAIEEDLIKSMNSFLLGSFDVNDSDVKKNKLNRIGNIFVPDEFYVKFEEWHNKFIAERVKQKQIWSPSEYIFEMGKAINDKNSILFWASKNNIPIYCPGFVDGAMGDHWFFFNQDAKTKIVIDTAKDLKNFYDKILFPKKIAGIVLGGGIAKHHLIGAAILRDGLDYALYVSTGTEYDGSLSGAKPKEAVSWNKLKDQKNSVFIESDATIIFPFIALKLLQK